MARMGEEIRNPLTKERLTFLKTSLVTDGELLLIDWSLAPSISALAPLARCRGYRGRYPRHGTEG